MLCGYIYQIEYPIPANFKPKNFFIEFDLKGNVLWEYYTPDSLLRFFPHDVFLENDRSLIISNLAVKIDGNSDSVKPIISKIDSNGNVIWESIIGQFKWDQSHQSSFKKILKSHDNDGYVLAGNQWLYSPEYDSNIQLATLTKVSLSGDSIWYKTFSIEEQDISRFKFNDMEYSSDGGYIMIGDKLGGDPLISTLIAKVNSKGEIVSDTTSTFDLPPEWKEEIRIFPNPVSDFLYIEHKDIQDIQYQIFDLSGHLIHNFKIYRPWHTVIVPINEFTPGTYVLTAADKDGRRWSSKFVKMK